MSRHMVEPPTQKPVRERPVKKQVPPNSRRGQAQASRTGAASTRPTATYKSMKQAQETKPVRTKSTRASANASPARPATRKELKQAEIVRKKEAARKQNQLKNKERVRTGKAVKADPGTVVKPSIWEKIAERKVYAYLREMGDTTKNIDKFQRKRVMTALFFVFLGILAGFFIHVWLYVSGPIIGFFMYKMKAKQVETYYRGWKFERQLNFSKFTRLVIPYLKASGGNTALYTIFNKILQRTEKEADRKSLYQLMGEMGDNPSDLKPFTDYAERSSGTDMSHLFMSTIFDFQQSTFDTSVIDELGQMAAEDMMSAIDEIIAMKLRRFVMFPTKVVMSSFILVAGLGVGMMINNFKDIGFGDGGMNISNPTEQVKDADKASDDASSKNKSKESSDTSAAQTQSDSNSEDNVVSGEQNVQQTDNEKADEEALSKTEKLYNENIYEELDGDKDKSTVVKAGE